MSEKRVEKSSGENTRPEVSPRAPGLFWAVQKNHLKPSVYTFWRCLLINGPSRKRDQKTEGFCEDGKARAGEGTAGGLMRQAGMSCRRKRQAQCVPDSEEDSRRNYPIRHRDSITSSSVLLSSFFFPFSYDSELLMGQLNIITASAKVHLPHATLQNSCISRKKRCGFASCSP